jgi:NMD protein affecting ribosome stability and mRNA decay
MGKPAFDYLVTQVDMDMATEDTDGFANDVNTTAGLPFTLVSTSAGDSLAHKVVITPSGSVTGNYTLTGTDADGREQTETLATDTVNAVTSSKYFLTLTSVLAPAGIAAETVDIGWADEVASAMIMLDSSRGTAAMVSVDHSGTANWTIQTTNQAVTLNHAAPFTVTDQEDIFWFADANFTTKTADTHNYLALAGRTAMRMILNSYSAAAELQIYASFPD